MRFGTVDGRLVVQQRELVVDVEQASEGALPGDVLDALGRWDEFRAWSDTLDYSIGRPADAVRFGPPVPRPRQVFAIALNYRPHAAEAGFQAPEVPLVFTKYPSCITGPQAQVDLPDGRVDWEVEVVAVVGRGGYRIPREHGWDALAGLTVGQDLSERVLQLTGTPPQFSLGKSHPGFGPIGPVVVTPDEFSDREDVGFEARLGDEVVQHGRTSQMIFDIPDLVARISAVCPVLPGDLIFTGTPAGVGNRRNPPRYLQPGETLVSRVDGIGEIVQTFR